MPITPDPPFPKTAGHPIRSKDWNDVVTEVQRLDTAKFNRAGGALTGPLTIAAALNQAALGVGTANPAARVHIVDSASPTVLRVQSTASFGPARMELWSDPQGSASEWRPGYIESLDNGNFTGGLRLMTNGSGAGQRAGAVEALRVVNGRVGVGVDAPGFRVDIADRIRLRQGPAGTAGMWLFQTTPNADRGFVGVANDDVMGMWGAGAGVGWAFQMNVNTGNIGIRRGPTADHALIVNGRVRDSRAPLAARSTNVVSISSLTNVTAWNNLMSVGLATPAGGAWYHIRFSMNGVQVQGVTQSHAEFRLLVDNVQQDYTMNEFHQNGWELRGVFLERVMSLAAGSHTLAVQWSIKSPQARPAVSVLPEVRATLTGCWYGDSRSLTAVEL